MTNWTKKELLAYLLIWCSQADFVEEKDEVELILSKVNQETYDKMSKEFQQNSDQQSIDLICGTLDRLNYSSSEMDQVFKDMKEMFMADGKFDTLEQNLMRGLKHIIG